jgi:acyl-coenzyme A thioesterase 9
MKFIKNLKGMSLLCSLKYQLHSGRSLRQMIARYRFLSTEKDEKVFQIKEVNTEKTPVTSLLWDKRKQMSRAHIETAKVQPNFSIPVIEKSASQSSLAIAYNFKSDSGLQDAYADARGSILLGKVFEDLDALAGNIAFLHVVGENQANVTLPSLVTASVDKITISNRKSIAHGDFILCGQVAWVGKSSLDIIMEIHDKELVKDYSKEYNPIIYGSVGAKSRLLSSYFTFVARDRSTGKAITVNKLKPSTESEIELFQEREELASLRRMKTAVVDACKDKIATLVERGCAVQDMPAIAHPNAVLMRNTTLENSFICQPQNGNTAGRVFGGFLSKFLQTLHKVYRLTLTCKHCSASSLRSCAGNVLHIRWHVSSIQRG